MQENQNTSVLPERSPDNLSNMPINVQINREKRFKEIILKYIDSIYRFALYMTGNEIDAQNLYQSIYIKAYKDFDNLADRTNYKTWLFKMSVDTLAKFIPSYEISEKNLENDVDKAMYSLPIKYRAFIILADVEGFSYKEISYISNYSAEAVASELYESRQILRQNLQNGFDLHSYQGTPGCEKEVSCFGQ